ncbi:ribonuclease H-like domain-containing protein [Metabacillus herbersteinensis]|uniref:Ribonuclease H-like domain-containing protein n=1 Tax=Metabacillus herbersteinensis TaxID=283816 RepID=A0ABV6GE42_9BACI
MSIKSKLNRLKKHVSHDQYSRPSEPANVEKEPLLDSWAAHQTIKYTYDSQYCLVREVVYPLSFLHGHYQLGEFHRIVELWNQSDSNHPLSCKGHKASDLFFFDTETTGLGGGAGNTIFLLGQAQVFSDKVVIKQHFLAEPGNEIALYQSFLNGINSKTLVTYNGKAFDWPQVKTRHTLIRDSIPKLPSFGHFDLFHASRRLWKNQLESVKLAIVEKEILNIKRENDIPGYLAPMLYFHYLEHQSPDSIIGVMKHNEIDVLSLITLYIHLSLKILHTSERATDLEQFEVAKWLDSVGEKKAAFSTYQALTEKGSKKDHEAKYAMALHLKKEKNWVHALTLWKELSGSSHGEIKTQSEIELAKFYEHKEKRLDLALFYANEANRTLKSREQMIKEELARESLEISKRINRIMRKISG